MPRPESDWRLQGQERFLKGKELRFKNYSDRKTSTDHDHCAFCSAKFSDHIPDTLREGYATLDDNRWICKECFMDFSEMFEFKLIKE